MDHALLEFSDRRFTIDATTSDLTGDRVYMIGQRFVHKVPASKLRQWGKEKADILVAGQIIDEEHV